MMKHVLMASILASVFWKSYLGIELIVGIPKVRIATLNWDNHINQLHNPNTN